MRSRLSLRSPAWGGGSCRRALFVLLVVAASCDRAEAPVEPPRFSSSAWANEPAGFTLLSDYGFDDAMSVGDGVPLSDGWYLYNPDGFATQTADPGAPVSPPNVGQWRYPVGFGGGAAPATMYRDLGVPRGEMYFRYSWKASNPWEGHPTGVNEISFVIAQGNILVVEMNGTPGGPYHLIVNAEFTTSNGHLDNSTGDDPGARYLFGNVNGGNYVVTPGQWYEIEVYFNMSTTSTSRDGTIRWWVNGTPVGDYTTVNFDAAHPFEEFDFSPTWGGIGGTKAEEDFFWYDDVRLSVRSGGVPPAPVANFTSSCAGLTCSVDASSSTAQASATYSWSWGDATSGTGKTTSHTYGAGGTYSVTLSVTDAGGTSTKTQSMTVTPPNTAPTVSAGPDQTDLTGLLYTESATFSDPDNGPWTYSIEWGDGSSLTGAASSQGTITAAHRYLLFGSYTIRVIVTDSLGAQGSDTKVVTFIL